MRLYFLAIAMACFARATPFGYVFDGDSMLGYKVDLADGNATSFNTFALGYPVAILDNEIRLGQRDDGTGFIYDLNGNPTGGTFTGSGIFSQLLDGTTNGIHNFGVTCCDADQVAGENVIQTDTHWQGSSVLFQIPASGSGIAYDTATGTLFVSFFDNSVHQYSLAGVDLGAFDLGFFPAGLAYDKSSNTLWALDPSNSTFVQLTTSGNVVGNVTSSVEFVNPFGFEIDNGITSVGVVPEPGTLSLFGAALAILASRRAVRRKK